MASGTRTSPRYIRYNLEQSHIPSTLASRDRVSRAALLLDSFYHLTGRACYLAFRGCHDTRDKTTQLPRFWSLCLCTGDSRQLPRLPGEVRGVPVLMQMSLLWFEDDLASYPMVTTS